MNNNKPTTIVIFGASGDLARRKLLPALFQLRQDKLLPANVTIVGFARRERSHDQFRQDIKEGIRQFSRAKPTENDGALDEFLTRLFYLKGDYDDRQSYTSLNEFLRDLYRDAPAESDNRLYYLSTPPTAFWTIISHLGKAGLIADPHETDRWSRVIIEKPFGRSLASARELNRQILSVLDESQVYRIDHYLGKETVQNIMAFRFGNSIFEPLWNRRYVDHVQITVSETVPVGKRAGYYDSAGAIRDMVQNHIMQLVALTAMEPPASFADNAVRDEKVKVLEALRPIPPGEVAQSTVRGQYSAGEINGVSIPNYRNEQGVKPESRTETFVAMKIFVDNWRWAGVPFYLRTGKAMAERLSEITIVYHQPPLALFQHEWHAGHREGDAKHPNILTLRLQPDEGIRLNFGLKIPGSRMVLQPNEMEFCYSKVFHSEPPEAYERLLLDALLGDSTLFIRHDEVEASWQFIDNIIQGWKADQSTPIPAYRAGSWGPKAAHDLLQKDGRRWVRG